MPKWDSIISVIILTVLTTISCKKNEAVLPAATMVGANTIGCIINNEIWVPHKECGFMSDPCGKMLVNVYPPYLDFSFVKQNKNNSSLLSFRVKDQASVTSTGEKIDSMDVNFKAEYFDGNSGLFSYHLPGSRFIITKFDYASQIISGEFHFILKESNMNPDTIVISNGRFDFKFNICLCD